MSSVASENIEPRGVTTADLIALAVGTAIAVALPRIGGKPDLGPLTVRSWLTDFQPLLVLFRTRFLADVAARACLALVPVVIMRRARYGGFARPAEFLTASGLTLLPFAIDELLFRAWAGFGRGELFGLELTREESFQRLSVIEHWKTAMSPAWAVGIPAVAAAALAAAVYGRRKWPGWLLTALVMVAWLGFGELAQTYVSARFEPRSSLEASELSRFFAAVQSAIFCLMPTMLFSWVPAGAAWLRLRNPRAPRPNWVETLAIVLFLVLFVMVMTPRFFNWGERPEFWARRWSFLPAALGAIALGLFLSRRLLPRWCGFAAGSSTTPEEAGP